MTDSPSARLESITEHEPPPAALRQADAEARQAGLDVGLSSSLQFSFVWRIPIG